MDWLNMMGHPAVRLWLAQSAVIFFLLVGMALLAFGVGLLVNSEAALRFIGRMNRWVSMRAATRPLEIPRDTRRAVQKYRLAFAVAFVLGGGFALYGLMLQFNALAVVKLLGLNALHPNAAGWLVDSLRALLVLGNALAVVAGIMLALFPAQLDALESRAGRWISARKATKGADDMHVRLDSWVAVYPRAVGTTAVVIALLMVGVFGLMLPQVW
jgi:hypothetical protein